MKRIRCCLLLLAFSVVSIASAQPGTNVWVEPPDMDAPEGVPGRQNTIGTGELTMIQGFLNPSKGDFVDTFCIVIDDPMSFYASTSAHLGGSFLGPTERLANTRIWLWAASEITEGDVATMALANDDDALGADFGSTVSDPISFEMLTTGFVDPSASGIQLVSGSRYLVSISSSDNNPLDAAGVALAEIDPSGLTRLYGPNPNAGPFSEWANPAAQVDAGSYIIALSGASFCLVPEPDPATALLGFAGLIFIVIRTRRASLVRGQQLSPRWP